MAVIFLALLLQVARLLAPVSRSSRRWSPSNSKGLFERRSSLKELAEEGRHPNGGNPSGACTRSSLVPLVFCLLLYMGTLLLPSSTSRG